MENYKDFDVVVVVKRGAVQNIRAKDETLQVLILDLDISAEWEEKVTAYLALKEDKNFHNV